MIMSSNGRPPTPEERKANVLHELSLMAQVDRLDVVMSIFATSEPNRPDCNVDVTPLREHFLLQHARDGLTAVGVAERLGWMYGSGTDRTPARGDGTRVLRRLGLQADRGKNSRFHVRRFLSYEVAVAMCDALNVDYFEVDV